MNENRERNESFFGVTPDGFMLFKEDTIHYEVEYVDIKTQEEEVEICTDKIEAFATYVQSIKTNGNAVIKKVITYAGCQPSELLDVEDMQSVMLRLLQAKEMCKKLKDKPEKFDGLPEAKDACSSAYGLLEWIIHGKDLV